MTIGYALPLSYEPNFEPLRRPWYTTLPSTAPAQGREGVKIRELLFRVFSLSTPAVRLSAEAEQLQIALQRIQVELSQQLLQGLDPGTYDPIPVKPAFTVNATYRFVGKLKPRQLNLDE